MAKPATTPARRILGLPDPARTDGSGGRDET